MQVWKLNRSRDLLAPDHSDPGFREEPSGPSKFQRTLRIGAARANYEVRLFVRRKGALFFTLLLPVMFLLLFGLIFGSGKVEGHWLTFAWVLILGSTA